MLKLGSGECLQTVSIELTPPIGLVASGQWVWLEDIGLGLALWEGQFEEEISWLWLRWCDREGQVIYTGAEASEMERQRADAEHQRADSETQRADAERLRAERLADRLRAMGINPDEV